MKRVLLRHDIVPELSSVARSRALLQQVLDATVGDSSLVNRVLLCQSEAITNLVEHARPAARRIELRFEFSDHRWLLVISDDGGFFPLPTAQDSALSVVDEMAEGGRGMALIHASCSDVEYRRDGAFNQLTLAWPETDRETRKRLLLVEDDSAMRLLMQNYLAADYRVSVAANGVEALAIIEQQSFDLIISDILMPEMNGLELRSKLSSMEDRELVPFIFLTGSEEQELLHQATALGIDDYLVKPLTRDALINHIERVLNRSRQLLRRLSQRLDRKISNSFIPSLPARLGDWQSAFFSHSSGTGGGDFILYQTDAQRSVVGLFDMMGHDESAKFFSYAYGGFISGILRGEEQGQPRPIEVVLKNISDLACHDELLSKIMLTGTLLEPGSAGRIRIASAAHPQPLLIDTQGIRAVPVEGVLPGLLPDAHFESLELRLDPGQRLAIYTDGLFESAPDQAGRLELEREIRAALQDTLSLPLDRALRMVRKKFEEIAGTPPADDTTLLLMQPFNE